MKIKRYTLIFLCFFLQLNATNAYHQSNDKLLNAVLQGDTQSLIELLDQGSNVNGVHQDGSRFGTTLICSAACQGNIDIVTLLLDHGAEVTLEADYLYDALKEAIRCGQTNMVDWFLNTGLYNHIQENDLTALLYLAIGNDDISTFNVLLNRISSLQNPKGYTTLLFSAAINNRANLFQHLVQLGGDITAVSEDGQRIGEAVVHMAASSVAILDYLLTQGIDINTPSQQGHLPLHLCQDAQAATFLVNNGAEINARDHAGWTPLHYAALDGDLGVIEVLLQNGAERNATTQTDTPTIYPELTISGGSKAADIAIAATQYHNDPNKQSIYSQIIQLLKN